MESCGIDLAVQSSAICVMRDGGVIVTERVVPTDEAGLRTAVAGRARMLCVLEASPGGVGGGSARDGGPRRGRDRSSQGQGRDHF